MKKIEKLDFKFIEKQNTPLMESIAKSFIEIQNKLNEIIEVLNSLTKK